MMGLVCSAIKPGSAPPVEWLKTSTSESDITYGEIELQLASVTRTRVGRGVANRVTLFRRAINILFRFSNINNKLPFNSLTIPTRDRELRTIPTIMSQLSPPLLSRPRLPRTSQEQVSNKRG